jgi:Icc-related predicted phosphoesterase
VKILCVSDTVVQQLENAAHLRRRYHDIDLILSSGDMPSSYLEFITSVLNVPLFYVRGNHDEHYTHKPPGGENLHRRFLVYKGISFYGIEGSMRYNNGNIQYSDGDINRMVTFPGMRLFYRRFTKKRPVDIFVTHSPPKGIHDLPDLTHTGFKGFLRFMQWYRPRYMVHGHVHTWDRRNTVETQYLDTCVMNINPVTVLEIEPEQG